MTFPFARITTFTCSPPALGKSFMFRADWNSSCLAVVDGFPNAKDFFYLSFPGDFTLACFCLLHAGLSGVPRVRFPPLDLFGVPVFIADPGLTNSYKLCKFRIFRPQGLHRRSEVLGSLVSAIPTAWHRSARITPRQSFLCEGLNRFSEERWPCLPG